MFAALNGVGLALLVPCCQSLIADLYPAEQRGRAFGTLQLTASLGGVLGGVFATNMGGHRFGGVDGWRAAFHTIAALSLVVGKCEGMGVGQGGCFSACVQGGGGWRMEDWVKKY
jgi:MFS family permease